MNDVLHGQTNATTLLLSTDAGFPLWGCWAPKLKWRFLRPVSSFADNSHELHRTGFLHLRIGTYLSLVSICSNSEVILANSVFLNLTNTVRTRDACATRSISCKKPSGSSWRIARVLCGRLFSQPLLTSL